MSNNLEKQKQQIQKMEKDLTNKYNYDKSEIENIRNRILNATLQNFTANDAESD